MYNGLLNGHDKPLMAQTIYYFKETKNENKKKCPHK